MTNSNNRGRPAGTFNKGSLGSRSFGPLGNLIRKSRINQKVSLATIAAAAGCSVQFISNIEHGRASLPWTKVEAVANVLGLSVNKLTTVNRNARSDYRQYLSFASRTTT